MDVPTKAIRLTAVVGAIDGPPRVEHTARSDDGPEELLPLPDVVLIKKPPSEGAVLCRYTRSGEFCGDTWHEAIDQAKEQADLEYGSALGEWMEVPDAVENALDYAIRIVRKDEA